MNQFYICLVVSLILVTGPLEALPGEFQNAKEKREDKETIVDQAGLREPPVSQGGELTADSLQWIDQLEMRLDAAAGAGRVTKGFAEIVNPFRVRKRGRFYGSVYEYHRNDNFDARNFFDPVGEPLPEFKRNQFGVSFGSLLTNKLTVFGTYDGLRIIRGSTIVSHIPTTAMKGGDFSSVATSLVNPFTGELFPNNQIPSFMIHPVSQRMFSTIPAPNRAEEEIRNYVNSQPEIEDQDTFTGRVDYEFSDDTKLFGRYTLEERYGENPTELPTFGVTEESRDQNFSLDLTRNFGPQLVSALKFEARRSARLQLSKNAGQVGLLDSLGIDGVSTLDELDEGYPEFRLDGYATIGLTRRNDSPRTSFRNDFQLEGTLTWAPNSHQLNFGLELGYQQINNNRSRGGRRGRFDFSGTYTGDAFADFLLGIPDLAERGVGSDRGDFRRRSWRISFRDDWKINSRFQLSFLMAYNYFSPYWSVHDNVSLFWPLLFEPPLDGELVTVGSQRAADLGLAGLGPGEVVYPDRNDWAPGLGLAFSPLGNNRLVMRASYEVRYEPMESRDAEEFIGRNFPFFYYEEADAPPDSPDLDLSSPFGSAAPAELAILGLDPFTRNSYLQQWQFSVQTEVVRNWTVEVAYEGRKGTHVNLDFPGNVPLPGSGNVQKRRPNPAFGRFDISSGRAASIGHQLRMQLEKRLSSGFSIRSEYALDKNLSNVFRRDPSNPRNLAAERGLRGEQRLHQFSVNYIYDLPIGPEQAVSTNWAGKFGWLFEGWRLSGITRIQGGYPINLEVSGDPNHDGVSGDRPDRIGPGVLDSSLQSIDRWFATEDFDEPESDSFGNAGRNILMSPGLQTWDISLVKRTRLFKEGHILEFRAQFFNAFNNVNFEEPETTFGTKTFGQIFGAGRSREIELALKYSF